MNDQLKAKDLQIDLNDKLAFIKHLFDGSAEDFSRVVSQINTLDSFEQAKDIVLNMIKADHNNWEGKETYETRFMELIEARFK